MRINIIKVLSGLLLISSLFSISASANTLQVGWNIHNKLADRTVWGYMYSDGTFATGWCLINGDWYFFDAEGVGYSGTAYKDSKGNWVDTNSTSFTINGKDYFFDNEGRLMTNTDIYQGSGHFKYHLDANGNFQDIYNN